MNRKMNVLALIVNDNYCATILNNGEIRFLRKKDTNNQENVFYDYLTLENDLVKNEEEFNKKSVDLEIVTGNSNVLIIQSLLSIVVTILLFLFIKDIPSIIAILSKIFTSAISIASMGMLAQNEIKYNNLSKDMRQLKRKANTLYRNINRLEKQSSIVVSPLVNRNRLLMPQKENIKMAASKIYPLLLKYFKNELSDEIVDKTVIYFENDYIKEEEVTVNFDNKEEKEIDYLSLGRIHFENPVLEEEKQKVYKKSL